MVTQFQPAGSNRPRVVELFAGVGGFRVALDRSGWQTVWSNQWEPSTKAQHASDCYVARFGADGHVNRDISAVMDGAELSEIQLPDHELLVGGFPCFTAGTHILTAAGYRPIDEVTVGDLVLTHRGRWRPITSVMRRVAESTVVIRGQGFPDIRTTDEHPFWARRREHAWDPIGRRTVRTFCPPEWLAAERIDDSTFVSQVYPTEHPVPPVDIEQDADFFWLVGRYLADGWRATPNGKGRVVICASKAEADEVEERIRRVLPCTRSEERTVVKFHITRSWLHRWLETFGTGASGKRIPGWAFALDAPRAAALLDGYATGDGSAWQGGWRSTTVSRALALGLALLAQRAYGVVASIHEAVVPPQTVIEGRSVNQRRQYQLVVPPRNRTAFVDGAYGWKLASAPKVAAGAEVYNVSVADDESYVADGCVVHNCQDYSVAKTLNQAHGMIGKKGVLWWQIQRLVRLKRPPFLFLENVDRLLKSPTGQRGRDFALMLASLSDLGYEVEWRVVNAADYGFPQKRRRVYIVGRLRELDAEPGAVLFRDGALAQALPVEQDPALILGLGPNFALEGGYPTLTETFGSSKGETPFRNVGLMRNRRVWTLDIKPAWNGRRVTLGDILEPADAVPPQYYIPEHQLKTWQYLKGAKREQRTHRASGTPYFYVEGPIPFPDRTDGPSRTILTGEGGSTASRFKHIIQVPDGRYRRLTPKELERLNGFPDDHTATGMPDGRRAFMMGNALVVGVVERIGRALMSEIAQTGAHSEAIAS